MITDKTHQCQEGPQFLSLEEGILPKGADPFFTTRRGGAGLGGYKGFNLGQNVGDDPALVLQNRRALVRHLGHLLVQDDLDHLCLVRQVHGSKTIIAAPGQPVVEADALVTREPGVAIGILTADCAPVLFYDPKARVVGAAHAGWRGALSGILESCIDAMVSQGARTQNIRAIIGPAIRPPNYEVDHKFFLEFRRNHLQNGLVCDVEKFFLFLANEDRFQFNLPQYIKERLHERGVPQEGISDVKMCTFQNSESFFSYRRSSKSGEGQCGRQLGGIVLS
ncbi:MAG: peptidoglycan editing factor PgeF [Magnetococcales bacterium]|nr:peptidoglycan editing factor PgeF [Magnetococcales bacterium]